MRVADGDATNLMVDLATTNNPFAVDITINAVDCVVQGGRPAAVWLGDSGRPMFPLGASRLYNL